MNRQTLNTLPIDRPARILRVEPADASGQRLMDLGLTPGARIDCLFQSPSGDPRAYRVRGAVFALRDEEARGIYVEVL